MRHRDGFTLVELLVVLAIIVMLLSLLLPVISQAHERGRQLACIANQRQQALAITMWAQDHDETYPSAESVWQEVQLPAKLLQCPTYRDAMHEQQRLDADAQDFRNDYAYSTLIAGKALGALPDPTIEMLTADTAATGTKARITKSGDTTIVVPGQARMANLLRAPLDVAYRHQGAFIASFCDGHAALVREMPPIWVVRITNTALFKQEVLTSTYPVVAVFDFPQGYYSGWFSMSDYAAGGFARKYRGRVKVVLIDSTQYTNIAEHYGVDTAISSPPTLIVFRQGKERTRMTFPILAPDTPGKDELVQQQKQKLTDAIEAVLKGAG